MELLKSASKIVFILMAVGLVILTMFGVVDPNLFENVCLMVFTYYFAYKGNEENKYLGK